MPDHCLLIPEIVAEARSWLGTPWHYQASVKGVGTDCTGVVRGVGNALGLMRYDDKAADTRAYRGYQPVDEVGCG